MKDVSSWTEQTRRAAEEGQDVETCGFMHVHADKVAQVQNMLPDELTLNRLSDLFRVFGDGTRIRILYVLFEQEVCVCDIASLLGMTQSAVSHQLRVLKTARLIRSRREGKTVYYTLSDDHVRTLLSQATEHICEE
ncbi:MAG: helix-turn-helix transcriptional regulator [Clostridia bacterium]|nr:helix-turn-helix transcriptional regulator [Clostridia bacterium]